ncbi:tyrosine--tRNA ligase [uncultured Gimesia sp.]|uniref:tyrosine--tRNA ligase n=1 Tax=uncultured Gimesia sp. TaxID=1678688 RepID=UPI0030DC8D1A|tara:strand:- start:188095 stop:189318 length:1224 start_codon:yes stop_codon:yes gene_type:complete
MQFLPVEEQLAVIRRGVEKIVPEQELAEKLKWSRETGTPLRVKYGIDPTGINLHLGHTVPMRKMRQFQELGHQAVIIIGNYTALVGDPSGRDETRARLTAEQVEANAIDYLDQVGKVIDLTNAEVVRNGDWFSKMNFADILELCSKVTIAQLLTRDDFSKRYREEAAIYLHECLYPIMQAWDSVEIKADIELGGTEQLYSFMLARDLQKAQGLKQQVSVMSPILVGTDGVRRMGKSLDNYIGISEAPYEMMKKFMQLSDDSMPMFYELLTDFPLEEVKAILQGHPKEAKVQLAKAIISEYHDADAADESAERWQQEIGSGGKPSEIPVVKLSKSELSEDGTLPAANLLKQAGLCDSTSNARRSIQQGGAKMGEEKEKIETHDQAIPVESGLLLWVGKKRFCQIELVD